MVKDYEENIIRPPLKFQDVFKTIPAPRQFITSPRIEFQDKPIPKPRTKTTTKKPVPYPRTKIQLRKKEN